MHEFKTGCLTALVGPWLLVPPAFAASSSDLDAVLDHSAAPTAAMISCPRTRPSVQRDHATDAPARGSCAWTGSSRPATTCTATASDRRSRARHAPASRIRARARNSRPARSNPTNTSAAGHLPPGTRGARAGAGAPSQPLALAFGDLSGLCRGRAVLSADDPRVHAGLPGASAAARAAARPA